MRANQEELLNNVARLKLRCQLPIGTPGAFDSICALARSVADSSPDSAVSRLVMDVLFKADDLFRRQHLLPEPVLRQMLDDRLHRLEATVRASPELAMLRIERRGPSSARPDPVSGRRWTDRLAAFAIPV